MRHCTQCGAATPDDARFCPRCGAPVAAAGGSDPMLGKVIADRYLLVEKVGQGGSGTIYRGEHTTLRKRVAVKVLHAQLSTDDTALERFRREATTVAELDNDHILQVLDFGRTDDNRLFFAMEHLEGEPLTKVIEREKTLPFPRAIDIAGQIAEALTDAHELGYVHRDLRPRNIFLTNRRGRADFVKLLDFGLAKLVLPNVEAKQTAMGMTFGDPRYMSPEQARGESLDRRSDIYSLGAIAFEMLTGTPPYTGSGTFEILQQHLDAPVPRVRDRRGDCPEWLDAVVQRALAKQPDGRFSTVHKVLESLQAQQPPGIVDAAEKAAHARLSSDKPAPEPSVPGPVQSMGPAAAVDQLPPQPRVGGSPRDTLALTTLGPKNAPQVAKAKQGKKEQPATNGDGASATTAAAATTTPTSTPGATSGSVEVVPAALKAPEAANVPSVVVESSSQEKTVPAKMPAVDAPVAVVERPKVERPAAAPTPVARAKASSSAGGKPTATPVPASDSQRRQKDPTGEWFSSDSQPIKLVPGTGYEDDLDELPKRNRGPVIIAGVTGGLILVGIIVIALLPKPQHKPLRGEPSGETAAPSSATTPSGVVAAASGAVAAPSAATTPSGAASTPSGAAATPSGAALTPSGAAATPSGAAVAPSRSIASPSGVVAAPTGAVSAPTRAASAPSGAAAAPSGVAVAPSIAAPPTGAPAKPAIAPAA
ncbi:MAG: serine/threonine protein kinase with repeat, partial [Myxococcales bacterium]|nr:serine/threonine protein kinase with repeat [Myxococcales bacterium]